jgi:carbohydrate kinase (thermoresistant glucokinase family)
VVVIVMGVVGAGKTTIGRLLAARLGWAFYDADDFHPPANVERMRRGLPLTDADREPWLSSLRALVERLLAAREPAVLACSALTARYRRALVPAGAAPGAVRFAYLRGDPALLADRLRQRRGHFAPADLLPSQLALLEEPENAITVDVAEPPTAIVERIVHALAQETPMDPSGAGGAPGPAHDGGADHARSANAALLRELEAHGAAHDARTTERAERLLNITPETGAFLALLVRATGARRILEIGTSNGYSTLWLAEAAADTGGRITTVERSTSKAALARATFARAVAVAPIGLEVVDAGAVLARGPADAWQLVFLDADRERYAAWWPALRRALAPGGLLVVDNATSRPDEIAPLRAAIARDGEFTSVVVPVGKGELLAHRRARPPGA